ncbi:DUF2894 domain-containing protein [Bordetella muralis]|uniref:DUF2894 domain-containing protein n=1 Tax=Bordetella muralis TaxID=1649130 RepID=UPI0039F0E2F3
MSNAQPADIQQTLDAWREQGADRLDPVRFQLIQTMANRAAGLTDENTQRVLHARLAQLLQQYGARIEDAANTGTTAAATATSREGALTGLLAHLAALTPADHTRTFATSVGNLRERYPELPVLDEFRSTWSRVSANRQVRQSEEQVHENAGPLNSNHLVHRALAYMRDVSPGYLHQFLSYLDTLAWVEQLQMSSEPPAKETKRGAGKAAKSTKSPAKAAKKKAPKADS